jgi:hypothetical protein
MPGQDSSQVRCAQSARSYEGREHPPKLSAATRSRPRRGMPQSVPFRINSRWEVVVDDKKVGVWTDTTAIDLTWPPLGHSPSWSGPTGHPP